MLFARAGLAGRAVPTLSELLGDGKGPTWTAQLSGRKLDGEGLLCTFFEHVVAVPGCDGLIAPDGYPSSDVAVWNEALATVRSAIGRKRLLPTENDKDALSRFNRGDVDYMRNWPTFLRYSPHGEQVALSRLASMGTGILGGTNLAVSAGARHRRTATEIVDFLVGPVAQKVVALHGFAPVRPDVYEDEQLQEVIPHLTQLRDAILDALRRPASHDYGNLSSAVATTVKQCLEVPRQISSADLDKWRSYL
jgi:multiple sugar transport system substrate-binding protein